MRDARKLSQETMRNIRQNLFFSFLFNGIGVPVAAGVLYPVAGILLSPMFAGAAMALSSLTVVLNALRLHRMKRNYPPPCHGGRSVIHTIDESRGTRAAYEA